MRSYGLHADLALSGRSRWADWWGSGEFYGDPTISSRFRSSSAVSEEGGWETYLLGVRGHAAKRGGGAIEGCSAVLGGGAEDERAWVDFPSAPQPIERPNRHIRAASGDLRDQPSPALNSAFT